jgi:hypothetical protein
MDSLNKGQLPFLLNRLLRMTNNDSRGEGGANKHWNKRKSPDQD